MAASISAPQTDRILAAVPTALWVGAHPREASRVFLVLTDADIDAAAEGAMAAKMRNGGQACTSANRFLVDNTVRTEFTEKLSAAVAAMVLSPGLDEASDIGPLVNAQQRASVAALVDNAIAADARVRAGATVPNRDGFYYTPTVLDSIPSNARILTEEIFGPVATIVGFETEDQAIDAANSTDYGLATHIYTRDLERANRVAGRLQARMVGINRGVISDAAAPYSGVKQSGADAKEDSGVSTNT